MPFRFETSVREIHPGENATVIRLAGSLDITSMAQAKIGFAKVVAEKPPSVVLDLAGLEFVDSSGISALLTARADFKKAGTNVVITNAQPQIKHVIQVVKALPGVAIFNSTAEFDAYLAKIQKAVREGDED